MKICQNRQGDVLVEKISQKQIPNDLRPVERDRGRVVLAYGEVTGHAHALEGPQTQLFVSQSTGRRFLNLPVMDVLRHEEHDRHTFEIGWYEIIQQSEDDEWQGLRAVAD